MKIRVGKLRRLLERVFQGPEGHHPLDADGYFPDLGSLEQLDDPDDASDDALARSFIQDEEDLGPMVKADHQQTLYVDPYVRDAHRR